jgi:OFA family oxalate/formate antiporter-like MFS transporter
VELLNPSKVFYGWWVIAACMIFAIYACGIIVLSFTAFFDPIIREFGWSYAQVSLAASLRGAETGLIAPLLGFFIDRWGSRWILFLGAIISGLGLVILSRISSLGGFYGGFVVIALGVSCLSPAVTNPLASNWFRRRMGLAMGILATGYALGGIMIPLVIRLIDSLGWRNALFFLGIGVFVICLPSSFLIRHRPEKYGYHPDGDSAEKASNHKELESVLPPAEVEIRVKAVLTSRIFWYLAAAFTFQFAIGGTVLTHIMPYLNSIRIDRATAGFFAGALPLIGIIGRLGVGWLSDRFDKKLIAISLSAGLSLAMLILAYLASPSIWMVALTLVLFSISYGGINTLRAVVVREYYGKSKFGTIFGFMMGIMSLGAIVGPFLGGWIFDTWSSYRYAWIIFTVLSLASTALLIRLPKGPLTASAAEEA